MELSSLRVVGILGGGVMGNGIATVFAQAGYNVVLFDPFPASIEKAKTAIEKFTQKAVERGKSTAEERQALLNRIEYVTDLEAVRGEMILEAIPENLALKQETFRKLEERLPETTLFATNTSSIPVTQIAAGMKRPQNVAGMHFFNPAPLMQLVEVIAGEQTLPQWVHFIVELSKKLGKTPALAKDTPGFIVNRVARQYYLENLRILEEGVAPIETIDKIMEATGFKMGPFKLMDLIGIDTNHEVTKSIYHAFFEEPRFRPSRIQQKKVEAGFLGAKTGKGFYAN